MPFELQIEWEHFTRRVGPLERAEKGISIFQNLDAFVYVTIHDSLIPLIIIRVISREIFQLSGELAGFQVADKYPSCPSRILREARQQH